MSRKQHHVQVLLAGPDGAGKTTMLYKAKLDKVDDTISTIGFNVEDINTKKIGISDVAADLTIWDVGGKPRVRLVVPHYFEGTQVVLLLFDVTDAEKFKDLQEFIDQVEKARQPGGTLAEAKIFLVANKCDLNSERKISRQDGREKARQYGYEYYEICAVNGDGMTELLRDVAYYGCPKAPTQRVLAIDEQATYDSVRDNIKAHLSENHVDIKSCRFTGEYSRGLDLTTRKIAKICEDQSLNAEEACRKMAAIVDQHDVIDDNQPQGLYYRIVEFVRQLLAVEGLGPYCVSKDRHNKLYHTLRADLPMKTTIA